MSMSWAITVGTCCCVRSHGAATAVLSAGAVHGAKAFLPDSVDRVPTSLSRLDVVEKCFAKVMDARLVYWGAALWDGRITLCYSVITVIQTPRGNAPYSIRPYLSLRVLAFCRASRISGRRLFPVTTAEVRRCQLVHRQASVVRVMFGGSARSETRWECTPIRKAR